MKRVALIGDVHAEDQLLETTLAHASGLGVDALLAVGDIADGQGSLDRCVQLLQQHQVHTVKGNHDRWALEGSLRTLPHAHQTLSDPVRAFLQVLPTTLELTTPLGPALLCHGVGDNDMAELKEDTSGYGLAALFELRELQRGPVRYMLGGHTHAAMVRSLPGLTVVNAGTLARDQSPGYTVIDFEQGSFTRFELSDAGPAMAGQHELPPPGPV